LEGAKVLACVEIMPRSGGLTRNLVQCLHDYDIPLYLSHTVTEIRGRQRVEQAVVSRVDEDRRAIPGTEIVFDCDTVLFSVGLIPENELARAAGIEIDGGTGGPVVSGGTETSIPGIFACGNAVRVHDIVDSVTAEGERAGAAAARYARGNPSGPLPSGRADGPDSAGHKGGSLPAGDGGPETSLVCVVCPKGCLLKALKEDGDIRVTGQSCGRGEAYARDELTRPARVLTSTVKITGAPLRRCPVKTRSAIPKRLIFDAMRLLDAVELTSPVEEGTVVAGDIGGTGIPWVTTRDM
ncbi:MAG: DUF1667 domain-containing protein, partial [Oscillospiraceae bacterium]|nr:DUF1667 domain-containing protein [Oscillospiraceae bacterium]